MKKREFKCAYLFPTENVGLPVVEKAIRRCGTSQSVDSSWAFLTTPLTLFVKVAFLSDGVCKAFMVIFLRPISYI
jgi:hypothetical protein